MMTKIPGKRVLNKNRRMPTFIVEFWNKDNFALSEEKLHYKRMWSGCIENLQTGERVFFKQVSEMLKFMEDRK